MEPLIIIIPFVIMLAVGFRLMAGSLDGGRIEEYIRSIGGELISKEWVVFGPGWFGSKNERIYRVSYRDSDGCMHEAHVKTSMLSGVYFTEDRVVGGGTRSSVEDEKARLRRRLEELEREG